MTNCLLTGRPSAGRRLTAALLIGTVLLMTACGSYLRDSPRRTYGESADDRRIHTSIKTRLFANGETRGWKINVDVFRSVVTLQGYVRSEEERSIAVGYAVNTKGVKEVDDKLEVLPPRRS